MLFLTVESQETMLHVAGLLQFKPTNGARAEEITAQMRDELASVVVEPPWNLKLAYPNFLLHPMQRWVTDTEIDPTYHVRRSALPSPGDERELGVLISRLHSRPLDLSRPPWEAHLIEGLENGNLALYVKVHHSLVDGYTAAKLLSRALSKDPDDTGTPLFFAVPPTRRERASLLDSAPAPSLGGVVDTVRSGFTSLNDVFKALVKVNRSRRDEANALVPSLQAPRTIFDNRISRNRRFATQQYDLPRLKRIAAATGGTLNDVLLAICAGGLRRYLSELGELPDKPLIAFIPVNVRPKDDPGGGNAVAGMLANLSTHIDDPKERIESIIASTRAAKEQMEGMTRNAILAYTAILSAPFVVQTSTAQAGLGQVLPPTYNVMISNVPGPTEPLYFRGHKLESDYPVSIPMHGTALNITCLSYAGTLNVGFIGCRDNAPHLQHLAVYSGDAVVELETAFGIK
ncbi:wax ester/triacylglycerol synthase family O-acyltransferase [Smaragdicoccus niigatensis]